MPTDPASAAVLERLGVAGILVVAAYFVIRYFMGVVAKKDEALAALTERFISVTERFATATEANTRTLEGVQESTAHLTASVDRLSHEFRSALGDAIVQGAHEAMKSAGVIVQQAKQIATRPGGTGR